MESNARGSLSTVVNIAADQQPQATSDHNIENNDGTTLWGYPKGVILLSFTEMWERFSYFGLMAILVLFLTSSVASGGFGWSETEALKLYGIYSGLAFTAPLIGGWIANNFWGERRCILIGGILIVIGHALLACPKVVPTLVAYYSGVNFHEVWISADIPLGEIFSEANFTKINKSADTLAANPVTSRLVYLLIGITFMSGLGFIISGTALLKPTISSIVGRFYDEVDRRRDTAFALFLVGIYLGEIGGVFITGYLGERIAWHWGFSAAGIGMTIGLLVYVSRQKRLLGSLGTTPAGNGSNIVEMFKSLSPEEINRIKVIFIMAAFMVIYSAAVFQNGGLLTLFAKDYVDRTRWGWEIPASWFMMITSIFFVIFTPIAAKLWERLEIRKRNPKTATKLACGLLMIGLGYALVWWKMQGSMAADAGLVSKISPMWLIATYIFMGISEVLVWTGQLSLTSRLAPKNLTPIFIGAWYVNIGIGTWLTGYVGALGYRWGIDWAFALTTFACILSAFIIWLMSSRLTRMMHGIED